MSGDPELALALAYAPSAVRPALEALWALDAQFGHVVRSTTEPMIGEIRLTWWHDALLALGNGPAPDEPLLQRVKACLGEADLPALAGMAEGWSELLEAMPLGDQALESHAERRGGALFRQAAILLGGEAHDVSAAGRGWALVDFAFRCSDRATAARALAMARAALEPAMALRWPKAARPLGILAHIALRDAKAGCEVPRRQGSPARQLRAIRHLLTGR